MLEWRWFRRLGLRLRTLFRSARVERELHEEFEFYVEQRTAQEIARGRPADEARRIAVRALDGIDQKKEECRDVRRTGLIEDLVRDLRYGARALARSPGFPAAASLSLALGIGANTAIFSLIDKLLLEALPVERPRELVLLNPEGLRNGWTAASMTWSYQAFRGMRDAQRAFTDLIAVRTDAVNLTID